MFTRWPAQYKYNELSTRSLQNSAILHPRPLLRTWLSNLKSSTLNYEWIVIKCNWRSTKKFNVFENTPKSVFKESSPTFQTFLYKTSVIVTEIKYHVVQFSISQYLTKSRTLSTYSATHLEFKYCQWFKLVTDISAFSK